MTLKPPGRHMEASARVKAVSDQAASVSINPETQPRLYLRSGRELLRSAASYQEDGQTENAYILYIRFLTIFLDKLRHHPNYKDVSPAERKVMQAFCNKILPTAEYLKTELMKQYEKEHEGYKIQVEKFRKQAEDARLKELEERKRLGKEGGSQGKTNGSQSSSSTVHPPLSNHGERAATGNYLPTAFGITTSLPGDGTFIYGDTLADFKRDTGPIPSAPPGPSTSIDASAHTPSIDRSTKPNRFLNPIETGTRPLSVPNDLSTTFLKYAQGNTSKNVETCALLTGKISGDGLIVTDLIIPKQTGSSDTCNMLDEMEVFSIQDQYNLISFGWIHTHPSQTAFLSSIDMHTHYSYQVMMPESIAIVCAPKHNQTGTFILTPEGMDEIGSCNKKGFHPHSPNGLFMEAPHCKLVSSINVKVHDLR